MFSVQPGKGRLELDYPTITLADLLLEKLQIHQINEKDVKDTIALLRMHELADGTRSEAIDIQYVSRLLSDDWEFFHDVETNLTKISSLAKQYSQTGLIDAESYCSVEAKLNALSTRMASEPKTERWKKRAKKGERTKWWKDVEEVAR